MSSSSSELVMFAALPMAADLAATLTLSDRTETRLRDPGDTPTAPSVDIATMPEARLSLASSRSNFALAYTPRLTLWDVNDVGLRPLWLDAGSARFESRYGRTTLSLAQEASYGSMSFADLTFAPSPEGAPPRVDVIPSSQIVEFESTSTTLGSRTETHRWTLGSSIGYQLSGGADSASRLVIPLQKGPVAEAEATFAGSPVDGFATTLNASETTFSSGPEIILGEVDEGWRRRWSAVTETDLTLGVSEGRVRPSPLAQAVEQTNPVAEVILEHRILTDADRVTIRIGSRLGPVVNRLLGIVDERIQGTLASKWTHGPLAANAFVSAQQSLNTGGPDATELVAGEISLSYAVTEAVAFDVGVRGLWQRAAQSLTETPSVTATFAQGIIFVGVTLRAPTMRL
jgi:hypothetical protein